MAQQLIRLGEGVIPGRQLDLATDQLNLCSRKAVISSS
jgi:hypothetical protein